MSEKPPFSEFREWARVTLDFDIEDKAVQIWTKTNVEGARSQIQQHAIVALVEKFIADNQASSRRSTINVVGRDLQLHSKSYESVLSKLYRTNVLNNRKFPAAPRGGWVKPQNMFGKLNDLVRSKIVCRHINEPAMIAQESRQAGIQERQRVRDWISTNRRALSRQFCSGWCPTP